MELTLYTSAFCAPCVRARSVLREAGKLLAQASIREVDVPSHLAESEEAGIASTPTLVVRRDGTEVFRASGVPSVQQVLAAAALALE
jgi:thiol-disulfide isomerase/thioredoxin